jgi:hypothetical protein
MGMYDEVRWVLTCHAASMMIACEQCYESQYGQYERGAAEDHKKKKFGFF